MAHRSTKVRVVHLVGGVCAQIQDLVAQVPQLVGQQLLECVSGVVGPDGDGVHGGEATRRPLSGSPPFDGLHGDPGPFEVTLGDGSSADHPYRVGGEVDHGGWLSGARSSV